MEPLVSLTISPVLFLSPCKQIAYCNFKYKPAYRSAYLTEIIIIIIIIQPSFHFIIH